VPDLAHQQARQGRAGSPGTEKGSLEQVVEQIAQQMRKEGLAEQEP